MVFFLSGTFYLSLDRFLARSYRIFCLEATQPATRNRKFTLFYELKNGERTLENYDWGIIGGGIGGVCLARRILQDWPDQRILILEKEDRGGRHASGRNSGVLHAGLYYKPSTLKARLCVQGARLMGEYCEEHGLPLLRSGKVVVPVYPGDDPRLDELLANGRANGVKLDIISGQQLRELEPAAAPWVERALHSPGTAIIDPVQTLAHLTEDLQQRGVTVAGRCEVVGISQDGNSMVLSCRDGRRFAVGKAINAAGSYADRIAAMVGAGEDYRILPFRGIYYKLRPDFAPAIRGNIYPVPDLRIPFLGVHFTRSVAGDVYVGPTAIPAFGRENYRGMEGVRLRDAAEITGSLLKQYWTDHDGFRALVHRESRVVLKRAFLQAARLLVPEVRTEDLLPCDKVGIRAQLVNRRERRMEMDFLVERSPHMVHVLNAVSPAFTCGFSFADYVMGEYLRDI